MAETPAEVIAKRRIERAKGRQICIACGSSSNTGGVATKEGVYRVLRGGMHLGNLALTPEDHLCPFCVRSGKVKEWGPV
jgi:RNA polymerase subunit RPABC4/transcription elongation factor Spt4